MCGFRALRGLQYAYFHLARRLKIPSSSSVDLDYAKLAIDGWNLNRYFFTSNYFTRLVSTWGFSHVDQRVRFAAEWSYTKRTISLRQTPWWRGSGDDVWLRRRRRRRQACGGLCGWKNPRVHSKYNSKTLIQIVYPSVAPEIDQTPRNRVVSSNNRIVRTQTRTIQLFPILCHPNKDQTIF